jgi:hypothetical protein
MTQTSWMLLTGGEYVLLLHVYIYHTFFNLKFHYILFCMLVFYLWQYFNHIVCGTLFLLLFCIGCDMFYVSCVPILGETWWNEINDDDDDEGSNTDTVKSVARITVVFELVQKYCACEKCNQKYSWRNKVMKFEGIVDS